MRTRWGIALAVSCAAGLVVGAPAATAATLDRPDDPVVLTGADVPRLAGNAPRDVVAFRFVEGGWDQVPVQVDERREIDLNEAYGPNFACNPGTQCFSKPADGVRYVNYTDPDTWVGPDTDPAVDEDDEIVFMAKDVGDEADGSAPNGVDPASRTLVRVADELDGGMGTVYLFAQDGSLDPAAGEGYVDYDFNLLSGDYNQTYKVGGGFNAEESALVTPHYARRFTDRWWDHDLAVTEGAATGVDIVDRHDASFEPDLTCVRTVRSYAQGEGAFIANKSGPVRAIRDYIGANSGPQVQRRHVFYESKEVITTFLRVHAIPGVMDYVDYSDEAIGMTYENSFTLLPVTIDGLPDPVVGKGLNALNQLWEAVDGPQGAVTWVHKLDTSITDPTYNVWYEDNAILPRGYCNGDDKALAASGPWIFPWVDSTDEAADGGHKLTYTRVGHYDAPGEADGPLRQRQSDTPLTTTVE